MRYLVYMLVLSIASPSAADMLYGWLDASAGADGRIDIMADVYCSPIEPPPADFVDIVIVRTLNGTCRDPVIASTDVSWPIPGMGQTTWIEWSELAPHPSMHYRYDLKARDQDGQFHPLQGTYPYDIAAYGEAVAVRGRLWSSQSGVWDIIPCEEGCWHGCTIGFVGPPPDVNEEQMLMWELIGQVLDFLGTFHLDEMPPSCWLDELRIEEHEGNCGPIPNLSSTWGDLKSSYR